jgi:3-phosphoinositide dependent protein kinase-1
MEPAKKKSKLDNFAFIKSLGEGAFGSVTLAVDKTRNRKVAIKAVNIMKTCQLNKERHVLRERALLNELKHPNVIELIQTFKDEENLYFVMEAAGNGNLDELVKKCQNRLGENIVRLMFAQCVNVMQLMQEKEIMHRDLKPQNIMLDENYNVKVVDYGDARKVVEEEDEDDEPQEDPGANDGFPEEGQAGV